MNTYHNQTWEEYWSIMRNLMILEMPVFIHLPEPYWNISNYRATLGHKLNHSFRYAKTVIGKAFHPRFGHTRSAFASADITKGEEIFLDYQYWNYVGRNDLPTWVSELYLEETGKKWYD